MGLLYLFISLWMLSFYGNCSSTEEWVQFISLELYFWAILLALISVFCIYLGLLWEEVAFRNFGLTFIFINFYSRYFEYFWSSSPKAVFFGVLGISLWLLGKSFEKIWLKTNPIGHDRFPKTSNTQPKHDF
jgi:hypothetical protein